VFKFLLPSLLVLASVQALVQYAALPDSVAYHFNPGGVADAFASKLAFCGSFAAISLLIAAGLLAMAGRVGFSVDEQILPQSNFRFYLNAERRDGTVAFLAEQTRAQGALTLLLLMALFHLVAVHNVERARGVAVEFPLRVTVGLVGGYVALLFVAGAVGMRWRFPDTDSEPEPQAAPADGDGERDKSWKSE